MLRPAAEVQAYLYMEPVDMRKSIDGLAALVEIELELSPMMPALFVFCNRGRDKIKLLYWERNGFVLWYKRLEKRKRPTASPFHQPAHALSGNNSSMRLFGQVGSFSSVSLSHV